MPPLTGGPTQLDTPQTGGPTQLEDGSVRNFQDILGGSLGARRQATSAAFEQLFTGRLSGEQGDLLQSLLKNRLARGIRGAAADDARNRLEQQFVASNRVAGAEFIGQSLGSNRLPILGQGAVADFGGFDGSIRNVAGFTELFGTGQAGDTAGFNALETEISGLRAEGLQFGGAAVNRRVQSALASADGNREQAFGNLFGVAALPGLRDLLRPGQAIGRQIGALEGQLQSQFEELNPVGGLTFQGRTNRGDRFADLGEGQISGVNLEVNDQLLQRLGLRTKQEAGGFHNVLAGISGTDLADRARERLGISLPEGTEAQIVGGRLERGNGTREGINFLAFGANDVATQAELLVNLTSSGFARQRTFQEGIRQNIQTLRELKGLQDNIGGTLGSASFLQNQQDELGRVLQGDPRLQTSTTLNPITGNRTRNTSQIQLNEQEQTRRLEELSGSISEIDRFRNELFSPSAPFFT